MHSDISEFKNRLAKAKLIFSCAIFIAMSAIVGLVCGETGSLMLAHGLIAAGAILGAGLNLLSIQCEKCGGKFWGVSLSPISMFLTKCKQCGYDPLDPSGEIADSTTKRILRKILF